MLNKRLLLGSQHLGKAQGRDPGEAELEKVTAGMTLNRPRQRLPGWEEGCVGPTGLEDTETAFLSLQSCQGLLNCHHVLDKMTCHFLWPPPPLPAPRSVSLSGTSLHGTCGWHQGPEVAVTQPREQMIKVYFPDLSLAG